METGRLWRVFDKLMLPRKRGFPNGYTVCPSSDARSTATEGHAKGTSVFAGRAKRDRAEVGQEEKEEAEKGVGNLPGPQTVWNIQTPGLALGERRRRVQSRDNPLTAMFLREHEELMVVLSYTVLNLAHPTIYARLYHTATSRCQKR